MTQIGANHTWLIYKGRACTNYNILNYANKSLKGMGFPIFAIKRIASNLKILLTNLIKHAIN